MSNKTNGFISTSVIMLLSLSLLIVTILILSKKDNLRLTTQNPQLNSELSPPITYNLLPTTYNQSPIPTPFPFQEMTMPALATRSYESKLGELEKVSENTNFTTHVTNYDSDGYRVNGLLTIPNGFKPNEGWPAVVFVHGYIPPAVYETQSNYVSYVNALADDRLVVFKIDLRGHDESEGEAFGAYYSEQYVVDVLNAVSALDNSDFVDGDRIGLWGHSMGGNVVFCSLIASPIIKKAVIWAGAVYTYSDMSEYQINDNSYRPPSDQSANRRRREELFETYGQFDPDSEFWQKIPAINYLDGVTDSLQIHHAVDDNVVDIRYSRNLVDILDDTLIKHELFEYLSGGHNLTGSSFNEAMRRSADLLNTY